LFYVKQEFSSAVWVTFAALPIFSFHPGQPTATTRENRQLTDTYGPYKNPQFRQKKACSVEAGLSYRQ
jgi:hypothetical protein